MFFKKLKIDLIERIREVSQVLITHISRYDKQIKQLEITNKNLYKKITDLERKVFKIQKVIVHLYERDTTGGE